MSKHTPGPWKVDKRERETLITAPTMPYIAAVSSSLHGQPGTGEANARLIAAAPVRRGASNALVENCSCSVPERLSGHKTDCWAPMALEAIAKAEGNE